MWFTESGFQNTIGQLQNQLYHYLCKQANVNCSLYMYMCSFSY